MKLLYVGCRVRILWSRDYPELAGTEGTIIDSGVEFPDGVTEDWVVRPDAWDNDYQTDGEFDNYFTPDSDQLEPVLPDGLLEEIRSEEVERENALVTVP